MELNQLNEMPNIGTGKWDFKEFEDTPSVIKVEEINKKFRQFFAKRYKAGFYYFLWNNFDKWYLAEDNGAGEFTIIGYLKVVDYPKLQNAWQIDGIDIHKNYQNQGLSTFMYKSIQSKTGKTLVSDSVQFDGARKIWMSLAKTPGVKLYDEVTGEKSGYITIDDFNDSTIWGPNHYRKLLLLENTNLFGEK